MPNMIRITAHTATNAASLLRRARERIAAPERWCQAAMALDANGWRIATSHPKAVRWSALGALFSVCGCEGVAYRAAKTALDLHAGGSVTRYNDRSDTDHSEIMGIFERAVTLLDYYARDGSR